MREALRSCVSFRSRLPQNAAGPSTGDGHVRILPALRVIHELITHPVYMNIPICAASSTILWLSLRQIYVGRTSDVSWRTFARTFDFIGLSVSAQMHRSHTADPSYAPQHSLHGGKQLHCDRLQFCNPDWLYVPHLAPVIGLCLTVARLRDLGFDSRLDRYWARGIASRRHLRSPHRTRCALSPDCFQGSYNRYARPVRFLGSFPSLWVPVITLAVTFLHNFAFNAGTFYLALYFQVRRFLSSPVV